MLQDPTMEKTKNRSVQPSSKGIGTESKKNQDVASGKSWPRAGRRREPVGNGSAKNDSNRKPIPQRNKFMDKRPKPRGGYYSGAVGGKENTGLAEDDAELGSVFVPGSKKQSLNHLLNFHYTPRGDNWGSSGGATTKHGSGSHRWLATHKHKYNKEQFLQANCQFIVNSDGDYTLYMNNPDALVDWDLVEQIHVQVSEFPSCPICLYSPVAAKMTRCGHVYCWSCLLHYLALAEKTWHKCPICYESVHKNDLKSVVAIPHNAFNVGEHIKLRLMRREKGSFTAVPVEENALKRNVLLNLSENAVDTVYSKLLLANQAEVKSIIERERKELNIQLSEDENAPEKCFIEQAITLLDERERVMLDKSKNDEEKSLKNIFPNKDNLVPVVTQQFENITKNSNDLLFDNKISYNRTRFESVSSEGLGSEDCNISVNSDQLNISTTANISNINDVNTVKNYYFYQAADGQHIYLHALNIRMLEHTYGSLENCPLNLSGRIIEKEGGSMTEELRRRLRYLQHLPVTCQFEVAEIQLSQPVINKETVEFFHEQVETRRKRRQRRARDEKRREKRIAEEENRMMGRYPEANINFESFHQFPECGVDELGLVAASPSHSVPTPISERSLSPLTTNCQNDQRAGPSFAKMLSTGKAKEPSWPGLNSMKQSEPKQRLINVTGSASSSVKKVHKNSDSEPEPEDYIPAPAYNQSFRDAIALALEKASISDKNNEAGASSGGKKKKKNKQKVLFATSMAFSGK